MDWLHHGFAGRDYWLGWLAWLLVLGRLSAKLSAACVLHCAYSSYLFLQKDRLTGLFLRPTHCRAIVSCLTTWYNNIIDWLADWLLADRRTEEPFFHITYIYINTVTTPTIPTKITRTNLIYFKTDSLERQMYQQRTSKAAPQTSTFTSKSLTISQSRLV